MYLKQREEEREGSYEKEKKIKALTTMQEEEK